MLEKFLTSNETKWRLLRTIVQGILGWVVANADTIAGYCVMDAAQRTMVVGLCMAVLSPIMSEIGKHISQEAEDGE